MTIVDRGKTRNFCVIVHIDHGKSALADRIIEKMGFLTSREMWAQVLDNMELGRGRGIIIKAQAAHTVYRAQDGKEYIFNLIDTPGHVDFDYEIPRSLAACDGATLVVDAARSIEAQTLANMYLALDRDLDVFSVINKIDLPSVDPDHMTAEIKNVTDIEAHDTPRVSVEAGINIEEVLETIVKKAPAPAEDPGAPLQALVLDFLYNSYKGVVMFCRVKEGTAKWGIVAHMMTTGANTEVMEVGYSGAGQFILSEEPSTGMVGYITAGIRNMKGTAVGGTVIDKNNPCKEPLPGYKKVTSMVYCGPYPADGAKHNDLRDTLEGLQPNDASLFFKAETSVALGSGFWRGFLGLLRLEIIQERLEREYNLDSVTTTPGAIYRVYKKDRDMLELTNPSNLPDPSEAEYMEEPIVNTEIMVTTKFVGAIMTLCQECHSVYLGTEYIETTRVLFKYELPLNKIIYDFFGTLKSRSRDCASFDHKMKGYERSRLVKLDILINKEEMDALFFITHADFAYERGRKMREKLEEKIPRHLFEILIQTAVGSKVVVGETVKAMHRNALTECYGGNIPQKRKLLEKQKEGKKWMRQIGNVEILQRTFVSALRLGKE